MLLPAAGLRPTLPVMADVGMFETSEAPRTAKLLVDPRSTAESEFWDRAMAGSIKATVSIAPRKFTLPSEIRVLCIVRFFMGFLWDFSFRPVVFAWRRYKPEKEASPWGSYPISH